MKSSKMRRFSTIHGQKPVAILIQCGPEPTIANLPQSGRRYLFGCGYFGRLDGEELCSLVNNIEKQQLRECLTPA